MADNQKYYYMRLKEDFFDSEEMRLLESLPDGYLYSNILLKLYLMSLKRNGCLMFNERIPYNAQMLATLTRHQIGTVEKALEVLKGFQLIDVTDTGAMYMLDIQSYIGRSSTEADRKRQYRDRIAEEKKAALLEANGSQNGTKDICPDNSGQTFTRDKRLEIRDKSIEIREGGIESALAAPEPSPLPAEKQKKRIDYQQVVDLYNSVCVSLPKVNSLSEDRKKAIRGRVNTYGMDMIALAFEKAEASSFLRGKNARNWVANFDWLIKDSSMAKVLDGNYDDKKGQSDSGCNDKQGKRGGRYEIVPDWMDENVQKVGAEETLRAAKAIMGDNPEMEERIRKLKERCEQGG